MCTNRESVVPLQGKRKMVAAFGKERCSYAWKRLVDLRKVSSDKKKLVVSGK